MVGLNSCTLSFSFRSIATLPPSVCTRTQQLLPLILAYTRIHFAIVSTIRFILWEGGINGDAEKLRCEDTHRQSSHRHNLTDVLLLLMFFSLNFRVLCIFVQEKSQPITWCTLHFFFIIAFAYAIKHCLVWLVWLLLFFCFVLFHYCVCYSFSTLLGAYFQRPPHI